MKVHINGSMKEFKAKKISPEELIIQLNLKGKRFAIERNGEIISKNSFDEIDAKEIVIDEFIGQAIPILTIYNFIGKNNNSNFIFYTMIAFLLFRLFDILKPFPINKIDKNMKDGFGVILDDIVAGFFSAIVLIIIISLIYYV
jgi:thiamine biosynthesis protein ThiS